MINQKDYRGRWGGKAFFLKWALLAALVAALSGCGGSGGQGLTEAKSDSPAPRGTAALCEPGSSILSHVPGAPAMWKGGPGPALALTCSLDRVDPGAALAGYATSDGGACVSAYSSRLREAFGELCRTPGVHWTAGCEPRGCIHYFGHRGKSTVLAGPVPAGVEGVWVGINGKQVMEGVMLGSVRGKWMRAIGAKEPFGYFGAYIPRCVEPSEVKVHVVAADGTQLGTASGWHRAASKCRRSE